MGIIGNLNSENNEVSKHVDKEDYITVLFHIGFPTKGGETNYYSGLTSKNFGKMTHFWSHQGYLWLTCDN